MSIQQPGHQAGHQQGDLLVIETSSVVGGYRALNALGSLESTSLGLSPIRILDAEPIGAGRFLILARGAAKDLHEAGTKAGALEDALEHDVIELISQDVLDALYSLAPTALDEALLVAETHTATSMFALAQTLVTGHQLRAIEIKIRKSGTGGAYAMFTGPSGACQSAAADARTRLKQQMREGTIEVFDPPAQTIRHLFEN